MEYDEYIAICCQKGNGPIYLAHENVSKNESEKSIRKDLRLRYYSCGCCYKGRLFYIIKSKKISTNKCSHCGASFELNEKYNATVGSDIDYTSHYVMEIWYDNWAI